MRAALAGELLGAGALDFLPDEADGSTAWETRWASFADYHQAWITNGFYSMFSHILQQEKIKERLLSREEGERRLTNLLHLAELLHRASIEHKLNPEALIKWLHARQQAPSGGEEAQQLRLESDDHAVRILTIHKSKGLQFDYVFCPFTWAGAKVDTAAVQFHDPDAGRQLTLAVGPRYRSRIPALRTGRGTGRNLRLLYVALTRARKRCYWVWGRFNKAELSAPAYLLHGSRTTQDSPDWIGPLRQTMAGMSDADFLADLAALAQRAEGTIAVSPLPVGPAAQLGTVLQKNDARQCRRFERRLDSVWRMASFSALTSGMHPQDAVNADAQDRDMDRTVPQDVPYRNPVDEADTIVLAEFPKGTQSGLFFHDVLEHLDFQNPREAIRNGLVAEKLRDYGIEDRWEQSVSAVLEALVQKTLTAGDRPLTLNRVPTGDRIPELDFHFPLKTVTSGALRSVFEQHGRASTLKLENALERLNFDPVEGFIKGFIDLVFRWQGRYYLVDWKSNHLGDSYADYAPDRLARAMVDDFYFLQYHLYAVALDQWLRRHAKAYDYRRHFGGVYYIFLRGIRTREPGTSEDRMARAETQEGGPPETGVFFDLPEMGLIDDLRRLMLYEQDGENRACV